MSRPPRPLDPHRATELAAAASAAFAANGLDGASLNEILRQARMGKSSFYHRFADKAALHDWVTERAAAALLEVIRPPCPDVLTAVTFRTELTALLAGVGRASIERPDLMNLGRMMHNSGDALPERAIARVRRAIEGWLAGVLQRGREYGVIRNDLPADLLTAWTIASLTAIDQWVLAAVGDGGERDDAEASAAAETALAALWGLLTAA